MPAANVFSYAFLTRYAADCQDSERLLQSIRDEMAAVKRTSADCTMKPDCECSVAVRRSCAGHRIENGHSQQPSLPI